VARISPRLSPKVSSKPKTKAEKMQALLEAEAGGKLSHKEARELKKSLSLAEVMARTPKKHAEAAAKAESSPGEVILMSNECPNRNHYTVTQH